MKYLIIFTVTFLIAIFQISVLPVIAIQGFVPNLILLFSIIYTLGNRYVFAFSTAIIGGIVIDLNTNTMFGLSTLLLSLAVTITLIALKEMKSNYIILFLMIFILSFITRFIYFTPSVQMMLVTKGAMIDAILGMLLIPPTNKFLNIVSDREDLSLNYQKRV